MVAKFKETKMMGGREVAGRKNCFFLQENEWSQSYKVTRQHPNLAWNFMTLGFLDPFAFPDQKVSPKKPLTRVSKRVPGIYGKRGLERG